MPTNENLEPSDEERWVQEFLGLIAQVSVEIRTFDYTDEQWADIEKSLLHLQLARQLSKGRAASWSKLPGSICPSY